MSNAAALQQLLNSAQGYAVIDEPYTLEAPVDIPSDTTVTSVGPDAKLTLTADVGLRIRGRRNVVLNGLLLEGPAQARDNFGIYIENSADIQIHRCQLVDMRGFGIFMTATAGMRTEGVTITDTYARGLGNNDVIGGGPSDSIASVVSDVRVIGCRLVHDCTAAVYDNVFDIVRVKEVYFTGNTARGRVQFGTEQTPNTTSVISHNRIMPAVGKSFTAVLVTTQSAASVGNSGIMIDHNIISSGCIKCVGTPSAPSSDFIIDGNIINSIPLLQGVELRRVKDSLVTGNRISNATYGVLAEDCANIIEANNLYTNVQETYKVR